MVAEWKRNLFASLNCTQRIHRKASFHSFQIWIGIVRMVPNIEYSKDINIGRYTTHRVLQVVVFLGTMHDCWWLNTYGINAYVCPGLFRWICRHRYQSMLQLVNWSRFFDQSYRTYGSWIFRISISCRSSWIEYGIAWKYSR